MAANYSFLICMVVLSWAAMATAVTRKEQAVETPGPIKVQASAFCVLGYSQPPKPIQGAIIKGSCKVEHQAEPLALLGQATNVNGTTVFTVDRVVGLVHKVVSCNFTVEITSLAQCNVALNIKRTDGFVVPIMALKKPNYTIPAFLFTKPPQMKQ